MTTTNRTATDGTGGARLYGGWQPEKTGFIGRLSLTGFLLTGAALYLVITTISTALFALAERRAMRGMRRA